LSFHGREWVRPWILLLAAVSRCPFSVSGRAAPARPVGCHLLPCIEGNKWQLFDFGIRGGETFS
jgi:hypothetical protein